MRVSLDWLSDFVTWKETDPEHIARRLTACTAEVEHIERMREVLRLTDTIFHVDNHAIPHRPDLFSHVGFARECVAIGLARWKKDPATREALHWTGGGKKMPPFPKQPSFQCKIDIKRAVPRYLACTITIDDIGITPLWMQRRLEAVGFRSINLPIDITNYVAAETGMPLHSFDADRIRGTIRFRYAKEGEKIQTLDGVTRILSKDAIVLSDDRGIFDLMGIMGGEQSSTKSDTRRIYLHSAVVDPVFIRKTILATGLRTDAATIYEKGIPPVSASTGFFRALDLFLKLVPGARPTSRLESWGNDGRQKTIALPLEHVRTMLGIEIPEKEIRTIFTSLGFAIKRNSSKSYAVTPPLWRHDIRVVPDLIGEIGRIYGFSRIEAIFPSASIAPPKRDECTNLLRKVLKEEGYMELIPFSLIGKTLMTSAMFDVENAIPVENPLSEDMAFLQPGLLPRILEHAEKNYVHAHATLRTFAIAHIFIGGTEHRELAMLFIRKGKHSLPAHPLLEIRSDLLISLHNIGFLPSVRQECSAPYMHPGRCGTLSVGHKTIGTIFELHPAVCKAFNLPPGGVSAVLCNLNVLFSLQSRAFCMSPLPQFPAITYDLTIPWNHRKSVQDLLDQIQKESSLLKSIRIHNIFQEDPASNKNYNLTFRCRYSSPDRTLREEEAQTEHDKILNLIKRHA